MIRSTFCAWWSGVQARSSPLHTTRLLLPGMQLHSASAYEHGPTVLQQQHTIVRPGNMILRVNSMGGLLDVCPWYQLPRACTHFVTDAILVRLVRAEPARTRLPAAVQSCFALELRADSKLDSRSSVCCHFLTVLVMRDCVRHAS